MNFQTRLLTALLAHICITSVSAFAACEDGNDMAEAAALSAAQEKFGAQCFIASETHQNMSWPSKGIEGYRVQLECAGQPLRSYSVILNEIENNVCEVKQVRLQPLTGAQCGLSDMWGGDDEEAIENETPSELNWNFIEERGLAVYEMSAAQLRQLPAVTQAQLILTAGQEAKNDVVKAVDYLKEHSEAEEVYVKYFEYKGTTYASVIYYGGGNPVGLIFKDGSVKPIAENSDGSISCL